MSHESALRNAADGVDFHMYCMAWAVIGRPIPIILIWIFRYLLFTRQWAEVRRGVGWGCFDI